MPAAGREPGRGLVPVVRPWLPDPGTEMRPPAYLATHILGNKEELICKQANQKGTRREVFDLNNISGQVSDWMKCDLIVGISHSGDTF